MGMRVEPGGERAPPWDWAGWFAGSVGRRQDDSVDDVDDAIGRQHVGGDDLGATVQEDGSVLDGRQLMGDPSTESAEVSPTTLSAVTAAGTT